MLSSLPIALGFISIVLLYWSASPKRKPGAAVIHVVGTSLVGLVLAFFERQTIGSYVLCAVVVVAAPVVAWRFARECWVAVLTPWLFSWRRVLGLTFACFSVAMVLIWSVDGKKDMVMWAMYLLVLLLSPVFALKLLIWWGGIILKDLYVDSIYPQRPSEPKREGDAYLMAWWTAKVRGRPVSKEVWLETTLRWPQFMHSSWWQGVGKTFWPDVLDWYVLMGTTNMVWLLKERDVSPPEVLDDMSSSGAVWA